VLALSNLLQIGDMISSGAMELDRLLELALGKVSSIFDTGYGVLYMPREKGGDLFVKAAYALESERLGDVVIKRMGQTLLEKAFLSRSVFVLDDSVKQTKEIDGFRLSYNIKNLAAFPLFSGMMDMGLLVIGNRLDDFRYKGDDLEMVKVFAKQMVIAVENEILLKKNRELAIKDELTDLYNRNYILGRLEDEIKRAIFCQRPCSFLVFNIDNFKMVRESQGEFAAEELLKKVARLIRDNITPIGKVARIGWDEFAALLPEKNKREATHIADEIRKKVELAPFAMEGKIHLTVSAGVSENPIDGATKDELYKKAMDALKDAKSMGKNRVGV
jgi:diguanylate cyclase (GGDEF)-like protein